MNFSAAGIAEREVGNKIHTKWMAKENSHTASACQRAHAVSVQTRGFPVIILADEGWFKMTKIAL